MKRDPNEGLGGTGKDEFSDVARRWADDRLDPVPERDTMVDAPQEAAQVDSVLDDLQRPIVDAFTGQDVRADAGDPSAVEPWPLRWPSGGGDEPNEEEDGPGLEIPVIGVPGAASQAGAPSSSAFFPPLGFAHILIGGIAALLAALLIYGLMPRAAPAITPAATAAPSAVPPSAQMAVPTSAPIAVSARPSPTIASYRVTGLPAELAGGPKCSETWVTFKWKIEGLGSRGNYMIRFAAYGNGYGPESGPFTIRAGSTPSQTWDPATGILTLRHNVGMIATSWAAEITKILNRPVTGNAESAAPLPPCMRG